MTVQDWLGAENTLGISLWERKYRRNNESFDEWLDRVSAGDDALRRLIVDRKFLFGGRALSNRGTPTSEGSLFNCFLAGHKVITKRGLVNIEDVIVGDEVITDDNTWQKVNKTMSREYSGDLYKVQVYGGLDCVTCTPNHEFLTEDGWVRADRLVAQRFDKHRYKVPHHIKLPTIKYEPSPFSLRLTDYYCKPDTQSYVYDGNSVRIRTDFVGGNGAESNKVGSPCNDVIEVDNDVRYLIGRWLGDGSVTKIRKSPTHSVFQIVFHEKEYSECLRCADILTDKFGVNPTVTKNPHQSTVILRVSNYLLANFFYKYCGEKCSTKRIPQALLGSFSLQMGLFDADGAVGKDGHFSITSKSMDLISDIKESLLINGIPSSNVREAITRLREKKYYNNTIRVGKLVAKNRIVPYLKKYYDDNRISKRVKPYFGMYINGEVYTQVKEIDILKDQNVRIYNLSVENVHSYTVNGLVVHNCYSAGFAPDDTDGLLELNRQLGITYKAQGGQGVSLTKLRPKGSPVGDRFTSDGIVPFMEIFNTTTSQISQGGARKGALMISLDVRHKEAATFITIKSEAGKIEKANLSLEIDDEFMAAVDTYYQTGEEVVLHEKREYSGHVVEYDVIPIKLYKLMIQTAYDWGEPGCLFVDQLRNRTIMEHIPDYTIETCNPCGLFGRM